MIGSQSSIINKIVFATIIMINQSFNSGDILRYKSNIPNHCLPLKLNINRTFQTFKPFYCLLDITMDIEVPTKVMLCIMVSIHTTQGTSIYLKGGGGVYGFFRSQIFFRFARKWMFPYVQFGVDSYAFNFKRARLKIGYLFLSIFHFVSILCHFISLSNTASHWYIQ